MQKAKSRLATLSTETEPRRHSASPSLVQRYIQHLPTLFLSLPGWIALIWIITRVSPASIKNWPVTNAYGPLLLASWWSIWFTMSFLLLKTRRGLVVAGWASGLLSLRLQHLGLPWWGLLLWSGMWFGPLLGWELLLRIWRQR